MHSIDIPKEERVYMSDLHVDHELWRNELQFHKTELEIFNRRLEEAVLFNKDKANLPRLEQFQNNFIRQREVHDELDHKIKIAEQELAKAAKENPIAATHQYYRDHVELRDEYATFVKIYMELRKDFMRFLSSIV